MDRIELGTQSLQEYRAFADASDDVQATENTGVLVTKGESMSLISRIAKKTISVLIRESEF